MDIEPGSLLSTLHARPFDTSFIRQKNTAEVLYGTVLRMPFFTKQEIYDHLSPLLPYYAERDRSLIVHRIVTCITRQQKKCRQKL